MNRRTLLLPLLLLFAAATTACPPSGRDTRARMDANQMADGPVVAPPDAAPDTGVMMMNDDSGMMMPPEDGGMEEPDAGMMMPPPTGLVYTDPPSGAAVRLVVNAAMSSTTSIVLELVASRPLTGYFMGMSLPIDQTRAVFDPASSFEVGAALNPGLAPAAVRALIARSGPRTGELSIGISQKASGAGAVPNDSAIAAGAVFFRLRLNAHEMAFPGLVFDGTNIDAGLRDKNGTDVLRTPDFAIGTLRYY